MRWRRRPEDDFDREVQAHLDLETDRLVGEGMSQDCGRVSRAFGGNWSTAVKAGRRGRRGARHSPTTGGPGDSFP
jgi:hypothetical protein